jgi:hypothetical protein
MVHDDAMISTIDVSRDDLAAITVYSSQGTVRKHSSASCSSVVSAQTRMKGIGLFSYYRRQSGPDLYSPCSASQALDKPRMETSFELSTKTRSSNDADDICLIPKLTEHEGESLKPL